MRVTLTETTIFAPENWCLEYVFPFGMAYFHGLLLLVSGRLNLEQSDILDPDELGELDENSHHFDPFCLEYVFSGTCWFERKRAEYLSKKAWFLFVDVILVV